MATSTPPPDRLSNTLDDMDPNVIAAELERAGTAWADLKHAADLLEQTKPAVLAELTNQFRAASEVSRKQAEDEALASTDYRSHLYAMVDARRAANVARAHYDAWKARFEAMRTLEATKRASMFQHR